MANPLDVLDDDGRPHVFPSVRSRIRVIESAPSGVANPFPAIFLGKLNAGPQTLSDCGSLAVFKETHNPEDVADVATDAVAHAFRPSPDPDTAGAPFVRVARVGQPTAAYIDLIDSEDDAACIRVTSLDKGDIYNGLRLRVDNTDDQALAAGRNVSVGFRQRPADVKVGRRLGPVMTVQYTAGATTATLTITAATPGAATRLQTALTDGAAGTAALDIDLTRPEFRTCKQVLDYINSQAGYTATFRSTDAPVAEMSARELDAVNAGSIDGVDLLLSAKIGAICAWINSACRVIGPVKGIVATRTAGATLYPLETEVWVPFAHGSNPAAVLADYVAALAVLAATPVKSGVIFLDTQDVTVQGAVLDWTDDQRAQHGRRFRAVFGCDPTLTDAVIQARAAAIGRTEVALYCQRVVDAVDPTRVHQPLVTAAAVAGLTAGMNPELDVNSLVITDRLLRGSAIYPADVREIRTGEDNARGGVSMLQYDGGVRIALALSTSQSPKVAYRKWSETVCIDFLAYNIEAGVYAIKTAWATPQWVKAVLRRAAKVLQAAEKVGMITPGIDVETNIPVDAWTVNGVETYNGRTVVDFNASLAGENDHIQIRGTVLKVALQG